MLLSAVLHKFADLAVVSALLIVNAVLSFAQERRAAGVVETLRKRLQVSARVRRDATGRSIPARELVPGDIMRVRAGDIIPADTKLLSGRVKRRSVGAYGRVQRCAQGARRRALLGIGGSPREKATAW